MICTGIWRVVGSRLLIEDGPAEHVGEEDVERDGRRIVLTGQRDCDAAALGDDPLETLVVGKSEQNASEVRIVLDDEQHRIAGVQTIAVVGNLLGLMFLEAWPQHGRVGGNGRNGRSSGSSARGRAHKFYTQG